MSSCFPLLFLTLTLLEHWPTGLLQLLQQDNHALIWGAFAWNTISPASHIRPHLIFAQMHLYQRPSLTIFLK